MLDEQIQAELLSTFQAELKEHTQLLTRAFLSLEKEPEMEDQTRLLDAAFRAAHSVKGAARSVGLLTIEALAHGLEGVLGVLKRGEQELSPPLFDLLYAVVDAFGSSASHEDGALRGEEELPDGTAQMLIRQLEAVQAGHLAQPSSVSELPTKAGAPSPVATTLAMPALKDPPGEMPSPASQSTAGTALPGGGASETVRVPAARLDEILDELGELVMPRLQVGEVLTALGALRGDVERWQRDWRKLRPSLRQLEREELHTSFRLLLRFLERNETALSSLAAELAALHARLAGPTAMLSMLTDDLLADVKRLRMVPFGNLRESLERVVRDLTRKSGKPAQLALFGADTELDRRVLEELKDPLVHLLRNALTHGIEPPNERQRLSKPSVGSVVITATQRGGTISIEIEDDGAGLDVGAIRHVAAAGGLIREAELSAMSDHDVARLIFLPGLSTSREINEIAGRGVGLDVVARNVERLEGQVDVETMLGRGTRFIITLPLTLATTRAILVESGGMIYALPTAAVQRLIRVDPVHTRFGRIGGQPVLEHDGMALPVTTLSAVFDARATVAVTEQDVPPILALLAAGTQHVALALDRVTGEQEILVKPLGYPLQHVRYIAGATILGSGQIVPILNAAELVRAAAKSRGTALQISTSRQTEERRRLRVLVADDSITTRTLERYILEAAGYEVELAGDGAEALALLHERGCDVLVSDVQMPELDGISLTARVRAEAKFRELPVILVTSLDSEEDRERGLHAGADAYIVKSAFDQDHLLRTIGELV
jgi:two-component system chemotaxis sensor kinase CheA